MFSQHISRCGLVSLAMILFAAANASATAYNDAAIDLSGNQAAPTALALTPGANSITGTVGGGDSQDWVAVTIATGFQMNSYVNAAYAGPDAQGFTGFQAGSTFTGNAGLPGSYAGYAHFGTGATNSGVSGGAPTTTVGIDLLSNPNYMSQNSSGGTADGATGYTPPLPAGTYTFLIQQLGSNVSYEFDMSVTAVPEPAAIGLLAAAATLVLPRRRRIR